MAGHRCSCQLHLLRRHYFLCTQVLIDATARITYLLPIARILEVNWPRFSQCIWMCVCEAPQHSNKTGGWLQIQIQYRLCSAIEGITAAALSRCVRACVVRMSICYSHIVRGCFLCGKTKQVPTM